MIDNFQKNLIFNNKKRMIFNIKNKNTSEKILEFFCTQVKSFLNSNCKGITQTFYCFWTDEHVGI